MSETTVWRYRVWYAVGKNAEVEHKWFDDENAAEKFMADTLRQMPDSEPRMKAWEFAVYETKKTVKDLFLKKMSFYITKLKDQFFIETPGVIFDGQFESESDAERALMLFMDVQFSAAGQPARL